MSQPHLAFGCELETEDLETLFSAPEVMAYLVELQATVCLGLVDLSPGRAAVTHQLNEAGIPVVAWQLLPKEQGYWFNADNAPQAAARYAEFQAWTAQHGLRWAGIGIDIEPDFHELQQLLAGQAWSLLPSLLRRAFEPRRVGRAKAGYGALVDQMHADGYLVESYQFPVIVDERLAGSTFLQRLFGLVDIPVEREILMLYTSFLASLGPGILWSYAPDAQAIGVGITSSGVEPDGRFPILTWDEFARDLLLARQWTDQIFVYSLEGCAKQGFLGPLTTLDWDQPIVPPLKQARRVNAVRRAFRMILWACEHPLLVLAGMTAAVWLFARLRSSRQG